MGQSTTTHGTYGTGTKGPPCAGSVQDIINMLLTIEHLAMTFYYTGLTSPHVMHNRALGGPSADPNNPGLPPGGNPSNVRYLQAALDAEVKHADALVTAGARAPYTHFYFPSRTFARLGSSTHPDGFLGIMETIEALCEGLYIAAVGELVRWRRPDLASVAAQIMGVESEHRTLGRVISGARPPNDHILVQQPFACVQSADAALHPFVLGRYDPHTRDATRAVSLPSRTHVRRVIGKYGTHRVQRFLWT